MEFLLPVVLLTCGGLIATGVIALWMKFRYSDNTCVLPRLLLIQALQENMERLQLEMESVWKDFASELCESLDAVKQELITIDPGTGKGLIRFMKVYDVKLLNFLRGAFAEAGVASSTILDSDLPRAGQTWNSFLKDKTKEEQRFCKVELDNKQFPHSELKEYLLSYIEELKSNLEQSISADRNRNTSDGKEVEHITQSYKLVKVLYATDRRVTTDGEYVGVISTRSSSSPLQYGWVEVGMPATHEAGSLEAPANSREETDPSKHVVIFNVNTNPRGDFEVFVKCIDKDLATIGNGTGELLVYIHGYNARHLDSIKRAAQLKEDLKFKGTVILYSWSSKGTKTAYFHDAENVRCTVFSLAKFLNNIMHKVKAQRLHILAHSMGNRALVRALLQMIAEQSGGSPPCCPLSQIIFVAADEQRSLFERLVQKHNKQHKSPSPATRGSPAANVSTGRMDEDLTSINGTLDTRPHLSLYCSTGDWPLAFSRALHPGSPRLGDTESLFISSQVTLIDHDVIDASGVREGSFKHHSYHAESPSVIKDIENLLAQKRPASDRADLKLVSFRDKSFYAFKNEFWSRREGLTC